MSETLTRASRPTSNEVDENKPRPEDLPDQLDSFIPPPDSYDDTDVENDIVEQSDTIADQPNAEVLYTDAEILGDHYIVKQMFHELGNQRMQLIEATQAKLKNVRDTPGKVRLGMSRMVAEMRYNRHKNNRSSIDKLPDGPRKRRRMARLNNAEARFNKAKGKYDDRRDGMRKRTTDVGEHSIQRRDKYISELKSKRETALARRSIRHEMRSQGASWLETRSIIKDVPKAHLDRVGKLAGAVARSEQYAAKDTKKEKKFAHKEARAKENVDANIARAESYASEAKKADETLETIKTISLPAAEKHLESLQGELEELAEDDPARESIAVQVEEARLQVAVYNEREIPYWQQVAEDSRRNVVRLTTDRVRLQTELRSRKTSAALASEAAGKKRAIVEQQSAARKTAINEITFEE